MTTTNMERVNKCACKGIRSCLLCEVFKEKYQLKEGETKVKRHFRYDPVLGLAVCTGGKATSFPFPGVFLWEDFISEEEEVALVGKMDEDVWSPSQSGRKKQDFGPKVNFKKQKVRIGGFNGLPSLSQDLVARMLQEPVLAGFQPVEQCNLDYNHERGSAIDPHLDDSWLWGERLVTISMLSDTVLTMSLEAGALGFGLGRKEEGEEEDEEYQVAVPLPRRSLIVLHGDARHKWKHAIHRRDVQARRVCSTYRELSAEFLPGGQRAELGAQLLDAALSFSSKTSLT